MANRFWVGTTANWATTNWSTTSGGVTGSAAPTAADDVFFDGNSGSGVVTIAAAAACKSLNTTGYAGTIAGASTLAVALSLNITGGTWTYSGALTFNGTATGNTITTNGKTINGTTTFNGVGGSWTLADNFTSASTMTLTAGAFSSGGKNVQATTISVTGTTIRTWDQTNSQVTVAGTGTVWNATTITNLTLTTTGSTMIVNNASATAKTFAGGAATYGNVTFTGAGSGALNITGTNNSLGNLTVSNTGGATWTFSSAQTIRGNLDFTGFTGSWINASSLTSLAGNLTYGAAMTVTGSQPVTFNGSAGTQTITTNGVTVGGIFTITTTGSTVSFADNYNNVSTIVLTAGHAVTNGKNIQALGLSVTGTNVRSWDQTNSLVTLTGSGLMFTALVTTNLTWTATGSTIVLPNAVASGKTFAGGGLIFENFTVSGAGTGSYTISGTNTFNGTFAVANTGGATFLWSAVQTFNGAVDFTGFNGNLNSSTSVNWSSSTWIWSGAMTDTSTFIITCTGATAQSVTSSGHFWQQGFLISKTGAGSFTLVDDLAIILSFQVDSGAFSTNGMQLTCDKFISGSSSARSVIIDNSIIVVRAVLTSNAWNLNSLGLTFSALNSEIIFDGVVDTQTITFVGGDFMAYDKLTFTSGAPLVTGGYVINSNNCTLNKIEYTGPGHQRLFLFGLVTINPGGRFVLQGNAGSQNWVLGAIAPGSTLRKATGIMNEMDYLDVSELTADGGAFWFVGNHSDIDETSNDTIGWIATAAAA